VDKTVEEIIDDVQETLGYKLYQCRSPDDGVPREIRAGWPIEAAENYAEKEFHSGDPFVSLVVHVVDAEGNEAVFDVTVEIVPIFGAVERLASRRTR
jgi:hypothetical protein